MLFRVREYAKARLVKLKARSLTHWLRYRQIASAWFLARLAELKVRIPLFWFKNRRLITSTLQASLMLGLVLLLIWRWCRLDAYLADTEKSVVPQLAIGIGAAITGIIAIAFSLSLFAIQQVADRGSPATVQAYARDRGLAFIYWALVVLAVVAFGASLSRVDEGHRTLTALLVFGCLFSSFALLTLQFKRVVKFSDPRYTIERLSKQGQSQLKWLRKLRATVVSTSRGKNE